MQSFVAIIPAGGSSARMGGGTSKLLLKFPDGRSVLETTLRVFLSFEELEALILPVPAGQKSEFEDLLASVSDKLHVIEGGQYRQESVWNGLTCAKNNLLIPENFPILIHDAARCFVSRELIQKTVQTLSEARAVFPGLPCISSIKEVDESGQVVRSLPREHLREVQTPQAFHFAFIYDAHQRARESGRVDATDDASLIEPENAVRVISGEEKNFKITTPFDFQFATYFSQLEK